MSPSDRPKPRYYHDMAYDERRAVTVLYGGTDGFNTWADTWEWDGKEWKLVIPDSPPGPQAPVELAYDTIRQRTVLYGPGAHGRVWEWDGGNWTQFVPSPPRPSTSEGMAFDPSRGRIVSVNAGPVNVE